MLKLRFKKTDILYINSVATALYYSLSSSDVTQCLPMFRRTLLLLSSGQRTYFTTRQMEAVGCCEMLVLSWSGDKNSRFFRDTTVSVHQTTWLHVTEDLIVLFIAIHFPCKTINIYEYKQLASWEFRTARLSFGPLYITEKIFMEFGYEGKSKGKVFPLQARCGPEGG